MSKVLEALIQRRRDLQDKLDEAFYSYHEGLSDSWHAYDNIVEELKRVEALIRFHEPKVMHFCTECGELVPHDRQYSINFYALCEKCWNRKIDKSSDF